MKKRIGSIFIATSLLTAAATAQANNVYYPYQTYEEYYQKRGMEPSPTPQPPQPPPPQVTPLPRPEQPAMLREPPEFLVPPELGYAVAIGVPYDLFYLGKAYYLLKGSQWYRSTSYRGPWLPVTLSRVPPELRKHKLAEVRKIRNSEFAKYFKDKEHYSGRHFRPAEEGESTGKVKPR